MLFMLAGGERTESEWRSLLANSRFALVRIAKNDVPFDPIRIEWGGNYRPVLVNELIAIDSIRKDLTRFMLGLSTQAFLRG